MSTIVVILCNKAFHLRWQSVGLKRVPRIGAIETKELKPEKNLRGRQNSVAAVISLHKGMSQDNHDGLIAGGTTLQTVTSSSIFSTSTTYRGSIGGRSIGGQSQDGHGLEATPLPNNAPAMNEMASGTVSMTEMGREDVYDDDQRIVNFDQLAVEEENFKYKKQKQKARGIAAAALMPIATNNAYGQSGDGDGEGPMSIEYVQVKAVSPSVTGTPFGERNDIELNKDGDDSDDVGDSDNEVMETEMGHVVDINASKMGDDDNDDNDDAVLIKAGGRRGVDDVNISVNKLSEQDSSLIKAVFARDLEKQTSEGQQNNIHIMN